MTETQATEKRTWTIIMVQGPAFKSETDDDLYEAYTLALKERVPLEIPDSKGGVYGMVNPEHIVLISDQLNLEPPRSSGIVVPGGLRGGTMQ